MKTIEQIIKFVEERIGHIYFRPRMYGADAEGIDAILHYYHELWAEIYDRFEEYSVIRKNLENEQKCGSATLSKRFKIDHPDLPEEKAIDYVITQWKGISDQLKVKIPYSELSKIYK